jgi:hypothetical protein
LLILSRINETSTKRLGIPSVFIPAVGTPQLCLTSEEVTKTLVATPSGKGAMVVVCMNRLFEFSKSLVFNIFASKCYLFQEFNLSILFSGSSIFVFFADPLMLVKS